MSPYQRGRVWWGRVHDATGGVHRVSLKTTDRDTAKRLEGMLQALGDQHRWLTLSAVHRGEMSLGEAWEAYSRNAIPALERELADGTRAVDLSPLVSEWGKAMARRGRPAESLQRRYLMQVRRLMPVDKPYLKRDFTTAKLSAWLHGLDVGQPNRYQAALSRFARFLIERGILDVNPLGSVERAKESDPKVVAMWPEDVDRLLAALPDKDRPWHALMSATGAEWGAIARARVRDFDPDALTFRAHGTKRATRDRLVSVRPGPAVGLMRSHVRRLNALPDAPLFPALTGSRTALDRLAAACAAVNVPRITIHDWRHIFAVQAVRDGVPYHIIAHQLGHANTVMVQRVYGRFAVTLRDLEMQKSDTLTIHREA